MCKTITLMVLKASSVKQYHSQWKSAVQARTVYLFILFTDPKVILFFKWIITKFN